MTIQQRLLAFFVKNFLHPDRAFVIFFDNYRGFFIKFTMVFSADDESENAF